MKRITINKLRSFIFSSRGVTTLLLSIAIGAALAFPVYRGQSQTSAVDIETQQSPQQSTPDAQRTRANTDLPSRRYKIEPNEVATPRRLADFDLSALQTPPAPNEIGRVRPVNLVSSKAGQLFRNDDGSKVRLLSVQSPGAREMRVQFTAFNLPPGDVVYVYGLDPDSPIAGPYTGSGPLTGLLRKKDDAGASKSSFWSDVIPGDTVIIEHFATGEEQGFEIAAVGHIYKSFLKQTIEPKEVNCHVDANCTNDTLNNAVAKITWVSGGSMPACSGTLVNSGSQHPTANDFPPYFLTANHCISTREEAATAQARWFFRSTACNSGQAGSGIASATGATLLNTEESSDHTLLRLLYSLPEGLVYAGSTPSSQGNNTNIYGLHHPDGAYLRRSTGRITGTNSSCGSGMTNGYHVDWSAGMTEGGSSGSGLFLSSTGLLTGVLTCGPAANCGGGNNDNYGKFADFFSDVSSYFRYGDYGAIERPIPYPTANFNYDGSLTTSSPSSRVEGVGWYGHIVNFDGVAGQRVTITLTSSAFDTYLYLLSPVTRRLLAENDDISVGDGNSRIVITLPETGEYLIEVSSYRSNATGAFQLRAEVCNFSVAPQNQSFASGGGSGSINITSQAGCPWTAVSNDSWITVTTVPEGSGNGAVSFSVAANNSPISRTGSLTVAGQTVAISQAAAATCLAATPLSLGQTVAGDLTTSDCQLYGSYEDLYTFGISSSQQVAITLNSTAFDAFLVLLNSNDENIASDDDGGGGYNARIPANSGYLTLPPGTYRIYATTYTAGQTGNYTLTLASPTIGGTSGLQFYPLPRPVRLLDTRVGETGCDAPGAAIAGGAARTQTARRTCDGLTIPANAQAITGHITTVQSGGGYLTLYPSGAARPTVASTNYGPNEIVNNVFTVGLGNADGAFNIFALNTTEVVVDVTGYYAPPGPGGLYFHPLPAPVRLLETRTGQPVGCVKPGAPLAGGADSLQTATTACTGIPAAARALVGNATTVSPQGPGYLTLFPAAAARPLSASSNYDTHQIVNGPFTTGLSAEGQFKVFTLATTELVIDVLGYYSAEANDANGAGLLFTPLAQPVRWLETRAGQAVGCFKPGQPLNGQQSYEQTGRGACDGQTIPAAALAVVGNATVVSPAMGGYLTLWPASAVQPTVATVNYKGGEIVNRHFIVGLGNADGAFKMFSLATTDLVIDLSGYFAP